MKIAYFGIKGSYTYFATKKYFSGEDVDLVSCEKFKTIFSFVESGDVSYGVIPIENSLAGSVVENLDSLITHDVKIVGELYLGINHCLLGIVDDEKSGYDSDVQDKISHIKKVYAHPQALVQCGNFLDKNFEMEKAAWGDNASAVSYVSQIHDDSIAAIGSEETGRIYGLDVIAKNIADSELNVTRFIVIGRSQESEGYIGQVYDHRYPGVMKLSLYFTVSHERGSLVRVLKQFEEIGLNLTKIESRPIKGKTFEYGFFVDAVGDVSKISLTKETRGVLELRVLGEYNEAEIAY